MIRGTTPTITITAAGLSEISIDRAYLTIKQKSNVIEKELEDMAIDGDVLTVTLSQEETLSFTAESTAELQLRVLSRGGTAYASQIISTPVGRILKDGVIPDG